MKRKCSNCGGPVTHNVSTTTLYRDNPADPSTPLEVTVRGLGTWHCANPRCDKREVTVARYVGAGKAHERGSASRGHNTFKGMDIADEAFIRVPVIRHIAVITHT